MNNQQVARLKEAVEASLWAIIQTQDALPGAERERTQNRILEAMVRLNAVWREVQNQPAAPQPTQRRCRRNIRL